MTESWDEFLPRCPVCFGTSLRRFDRAINTTDLKPTDILSCDSCAALMNVSAYQAIAHSSVAEVQHVQFYSDEHLSPEKVRQEVAAAEVLLDYLADRTVLNPEGNFVDFGAGRGFVAMTAAQRFKSAFACETATHLVTDILDHHPDIITIRPKVVPSLSEIPLGIDVLLLWHVLEHLPEPMAFWQAHAGRLNPGCVIFLQIPLFRPGHVVESHYIFYTERSLRTWAEALHADVIEFGYDVENAFLGMIAKLSSVPGDIASA